MRRANYEGSIYRRSDGRWAAALMLNGRRRSVYGKTRQEVADRLRELQQQATRQGMLADPGRHTIADLLAAWLEAVAPILKPRSLDSYRQGAPQPPDPGCDPAPHHPFAAAGQGTHRHQGVRHPAPCLSGGGAVGLAGP